MSKWIMWTRKNNSLKEENKMSEKSHVISTLVEHKPGVLQNVAGLLNRRGFNIYRITVGASEGEGLDRTCLVVKGGDTVV